MPQSNVRNSLGSISQVKPGLWRVRLSAGRDQTTGKRVYIEERVRGSRRDAEAKLAQILVQNGEVPPNSMPLSVYLTDMYLPWCESRVRADTVMNYENDIKLHIIPGIGQYALDSLDAFVVEKWLNTIEKPGARKKSYKTLRQALRQARRWKLIKDVVTDAIPEPKVPHYEPRVLDAKEAAQVLAAFEGDPVELAVLFALGCGLRRSEILGLDWEDVQGSEVRITKSYTVVKGKAILAEPKTFNSRRIVSIPSAFASRISALRPAEAHGPVLVGELGGRMNPDVLTSLYDRTAKKNGVRFTSLKNLRHSHATIMLSAGVDIVTVSRRLGHSSVSITDKFYLRPTRAADERAANAFDDLDLLSAKSH